MPIANFSDLQRKVLMFLSEEDRFDQLKKGILEIERRYIDEQGVIGVPVNQPELALDARMILNPLQLDAYLKKIAKKAPESLADFHAFNWRHASLLLMIRDPVHNTKKAQIADAIKKLRAIGDIIDDVASNPQILGEILAEDPLLPLFRHFIDHDRKEIYFRSLAFKIEARRYVLGKATKNSTVAVDNRKQDIIKLARLISELPEKKIRGSASESYDLERLLVEACECVGYSISETTAKMYISRSQ
jgi:hypothetical protein